MGKTDASVRSCGSPQIVQQPGPRQERGQRVQQYSRAADRQLVEALERLPQPGDVAQDDDAPEEAKFPLGAWEYHSSMKLIANSPRKPLRLFTHVSENDLRAKVAKS
mgnify:CR=1 FL=1